MNRRAFLALLAASAGWSGCEYESRSGLRGRLLGPNLAVGHRLRAGGFPAPSEEIRVPLVIIGGGVAGLSAGLMLKRAGLSEFCLLELESSAGGNARGGQNAVSPFPWGAHYLPVPNPEATELRELLVELGLLSGNTGSSLSTFAERHLCAAPQERLYRNGFWQEGLLPQHGLSARARDEQRRFLDWLAAWRERRGADGRFWFSVPSTLDSDDQSVRPYDQVSMQELMLREGFVGETLHWWANYACRDDYGTDYRNVSGWAGLHYFAGRRGQGVGVGREDVFTWPEGNAWLTHRMAAALSQNIRTEHFVFALESEARSVAVDVYSIADRQSYRIRAAAAIWAAPLFLLGRVWSNAPQSFPAAVRELSYAPWLVANLTLSESPRSAVGADLAWDNVIYDSPALGYVVATHQSKAIQRGPTVLTYYYALSELSPEAGRKRLAELTWSDWAELILRDLAKPHPEIRELVTEIDVYRWGHAMVRPTVGWRFGQAKASFDRMAGPVILGHSDLSGFSLFEEAHAQGARAARRAMALI